MPPSSAPYAGSLSSHRVEQIPEFNAFLFAAVGEEKSGLPLTVLSALSRLGIDPWGEAARLSDLPKDKAAGALAAIVAALPEGDWKVAEAGAIAARLVECLPPRGAPVLLSSATAAQVTAARGKPPAALWLVGMALAVGALFALYHWSADQAPAPLPSTVSVPQR